MSLLTPVFVLIFHVKMAAVKKVYYTRPPVQSSPDLNIIEAVWDQLDRERNKRFPKSKELWEVLKEAWYNIAEYSDICPGNEVLNWHFSSAQ